MLLKVKRVYLSSWHFGDRLKTRSSTQKERERERDREKMTKIIHDMRATFVPHLHMQDRFDELEKESSILVYHRQVKYRFTDLKLLSWSNIKRIKRKASVRPGCRRWS
ncbi:hypothetical protein PUN28_020059 [Cardiocondyla obscurior]|uniref:Uncharacterized protein n=1 Tax=Cardiocondyla obscurior TaxID=286306 RepID=A0AAW2E911_9HYME